MEGQRQGGRRRRRRARAAGPPAEPDLIVARRPDSPLMTSAARAVVASAVPLRAHQPPPALPGHPEAPAEPVPQARKRAARIVSLSRPNGDREELRRRLLSHLVQSDGRASIGRAADALVAEGFDFPREQPVQLQLLEHPDEEIARSAVATLTDLLQREAPFRRPVLVQRLRRLEEHADDATTRDASAELRRSLR